MQTINVPEEAMQLPVNYVPPEQKVKRIATTYDFSTLKGKQQQAMRYMCDYVEGRLPYTMIVLQGYAGVGKTYITNEFIKWLVTFKKREVAGTATTNKAVNVMMDNADYDHPRLRFKTIHSLLGLKESFDEETGKQEFLQDYENPPEINEVDVLIIDEASQLNQYIFNLLLPELRSGLKIILVGDNFQTPPVGEYDSIPFTGKGRVLHKIGMYVLDEIVRQALDSPIIEYATALREGQMITYRSEKDQNCGGLTKLFNGSGIVDVKRKDKDTIYGVCEHYFCSSMFEMNPDFMKVVSWRRDVARAVNERVRPMIYKDFLSQIVVENPLQEALLPKIMEGEKLVAQKPIIQFGTKNVIYSNNAEFEIVNFEIDADTVYKSGEVELYAKFYIANTIDRRTKDKKQVTIVHEDSEGEYLKLISSLAQRAKKAPANSDIRKWLWRTFYQVEKRFASINYNYAITAHKAQGSTYENCMVIDWDILSNIDYKTGLTKKEAIRILYTACTRPKKFLFLVRE